MKSHKVIVKYDQKGNPVTRNAFRKGEVVEGQKINTLTNKMMNKVKHAAGKRYGIHF